MESFVLLDVDVAGGGDGDVAGTGADGAFAGDDDVVVGGAVAGFGVSAFFGGAEGF